MPSSNARLVTIPKPVLTPFVVLPTNPSLGSAVIHSLGRNLRDLPERQEEVLERPEVEL